MAAGAPLPEGNVAFVFTDIEGSTRLFRRIGAAFLATLDRHNELLRRAWSAHHGHEVKTEGDGFFVAFHRVDDAVRACVDAQRALAAEVWPDGIEVRARMGIHAGLAYPRGDDYVALAVNQTARVESAAHGGQILVSERATELLGPHDDLTLELVGTYRVRDFDDPVRLFQVTAEGLGTTFPAVRAVPADRHNLTRPSTSFVGRDDALRAIRSLLTSGRLVTVVGPGGVGKTRLVTELGLAVAPDCPDGVWFVDLSPVDDPGRIPAVIAAALGAAVPPHADAWAAVLDHLRARAALLILDTAEHLLEGLVPRLGALLEACPGVTVLATSRVPTGAKGEQLWWLEPLTSATSGDVAPAVALFADRAAAVDPGFTVDAVTGPVIGDICRRVDGLPLAIELAAERVNVLSLEEILEGLEDRFRMLRSRDPGIPDRQRTLEALFEWSERLLAPGEREMLRRLAVLTGSFGLGEAGAVADEEVDPDEVPELVWALADRSLVSTDRSSGATRYRLLGSVQAYALRGLESDGSFAPTAGRLARWYVERFFEDGRLRRERLAELQSALDNVRGVIPAIEEADPETAQWLACAIADQHVLLTRFRDGAEEVRPLAERLTAPTQARVYLLVVYADLVLWSTDPTGAAVVLDQAEALRDQVGSPYEGTDWSIAYDRADLARRLGDPEGARDMARRALDAGAGDAGRSRMLNLLGVTQYEIGDVASAFRTFEEGLIVDQRLGHEQNVAIAHANLAETALILGRRSTSAEHALACLHRSSELGMTATVGMSLATTAHLAAAQGDLGVAVRLAALARRMHEETGFEHAADERGPTTEQLFERARRELGGGFEGEHEAGRAMPVPDAIAEADRLLVALAAEGADPTDR